MKTKFLIIFIIIELLILLYLNLKKKDKIEVIYIKYYIKNYDSLLSDINTFKYTPGEITKIIIKTSWHMLDEVPVQMKEALEITKILNPDYELYYFNDTDVERFMKDYSEKCYECYKKLVPGAYKADLFRLCILEKYGGCYSDIGHLMKVSFNEINSDANIVLVNDANILVGFGININTVFNGIYNSLICTIKNHTFFQELINRICKNIKDEYYGDSDLDITGPMVTGKVFNCYFSKICNYKNTDLMKIGFTNYDCDKCRVRILKHIIYITNTKTDFITDENDKELIQTKFDDYYNVMYTIKKTPRYGVLWKKREVFTK